MTVGQRIAQKRKELGLSQEALGTELGVSRQSIYKWESDSSLPEVEKLVTLARRFGVSVGWLLGVEEEATPDAVPQPDTLTEAQLQMVDEIVSRYLASQPKPPKHRRWPFVLAGAALVAVGFSLFSRLDQLDNRYSSLQNAVSGINSSVNTQIGGISRRVEELLKSQNNLTAEYGAELLEIGCYDGGSTAEFSVYAVPKTFVEGITAEFAACNGADTVTVASNPDETGKCSAMLSCELSDSITLSVIFINPDGTRQTQVLDNFSGYLSASYPEVEVSDYGSLFAEELPDHSLSLQDRYVISRCSDSLYGDAGVAELRVGLFRNRVLQCWAEPCEQPETFHGFEGAQFYRLPDTALSDLQPSETLEIAALVTDTYGRQYIACDVPYVVADDPAVPYLTYPSDGRCSHDVNDWCFD